MEGASTSVLTYLVVAGSPHEPMARSIALDLERKGFIVFVTVTSPEEEQVVQGELRSDVRPLYMDLTSVWRCRSTVPGFVLKSL